MAQLVKPQTFSLKERVGSIPGCDPLYHLEIFNLISWSGKAVEWSARLPNPGAGVWDTDLGSLVGTVFQLQCHGRRRRCRLLK